MMVGTRRDHLALRGHMVRRLPSKDDLGQRLPIVLTQRDQDILVSVYQQGFLTTDLVELAFFPPNHDARCPYSSRAYERLRQLWLWGYLDRVEQPVARVIGGRRPFLYALGPRAVPVVAARLGDSVVPVQRRRLVRLDDIFIEHDLIAARFWGRSAETIADQHDIPIAAVYEALAYAGEHPEEMEAIRRADDEADRRMTARLPQHLRQIAEEVKTKDEQARKELIRKAKEARRSTPVS